MRASWLSFTHSHTHTRTQTRAYREAICSQQANWATRVDLSPRSDNATVSTKSGCNATDTNQLMPLNPCKAPLFGMNNSA